MSSIVKRNSFTVTWILENVSYCWHKNFESIRSPTFVIKATQEPKFGLEFCPEEKLFALRKRDSSSLTIDCELALLSKDGSVLSSEKLKNGDIHRYFFEFKNIIEANRSIYFPEDKLAVRYKIWKSEGEMTEDVQCLVLTRICIERTSFLWNIRNFSNLQAEEKLTYQMKSLLDNEVLMSFKLLLKNPFTEEDSISIQLQSNDKIKCFELHLIPLNSSSKGNKDIRKKFFFSEAEKVKLLTLPFSKKDVIENKNIYLQNGDLSFRCECTFSTGAIFEKVESVIYNCDSLTTNEQDNHCMDKENTLSVSKRVLNENLNKLLQDSILSDVKLKANSRTLLAHKNILSMWSPVFKAMFENDMKEKFSESVDIEDLDGDTLSRMLRYVYTAEIKDLQWRDACELYRAADKYQILALRDECSAYLKNNFCPDNACEVLILADTHQDADLKICIQNYIFDHDIMNSYKWKQFMDTHLKLASDTMYLLIQRKSSGNKLIASTSGFDIPGTSFASSALNLPQSQSSNNLPASNPMLHLSVPSNFNFGSISSPNVKFSASTTHTIPELCTNYAPRKVGKAVRRSAHK